MALQSHSKHTERGGGVHKLLSIGLLSHTDAVLTSGFGTTLCLITPQNFHLVHFKDWGLIKTEWSHSVSQPEGIHCKILVLLLTQTEQSLFARLWSSGCERGILLQDSECLLLPARSQRCWKLPKAHSSLRQTQGIRVEPGGRNSEFCSWRGKNKKSSLLVKPQTSQLMQMACVRLQWTSHKWETEETLWFLSSKRILNSFRNPKSCKSSAKWPSG